MNIGVIGAGYVGLVAAACFAETGNDVHCMDLDAARIAKLKQGEVPIYEPGLAELLKDNVAAGRLVFSTDIGALVAAADVIFIAVGTPQDTDGSADLSHAVSAAEEIGRRMNGRKFIVLKSTVPVGTAELVRAAIAKHTSQPFSVVSNPEFLKEGTAIDDFMKPDRIVVGVDTQEAAEIMRELYAPFVRTNNPILVMDVKSAELSKYAANALLATKITFMNEMANFCEAVGADVDQIRRAIGSDHRIGPSFLFAGCGYGGPCFPKDVRALVSSGAKHGLDLQIPKAVDQVNAAQKLRLAKQVIGHLGAAGVKGRTFAIWGLAFKPKTDDMREAPSLDVIAELAAAGARFRAYDPEAMDVARGILQPRTEIQIEFAASSYEALRGADALIVITEWSEFRRPNFTKMGELLKSRVIFDGRNLYDPARMRELGFVYYSIGRKAVGV